MSRLYVLGSGSSLSSKERTNASYLVDFNGSLTLIDCSGSPAHEVLKRGFSLAAIESVFLTHGHVDHLYGLPSLVHSMWMLGLHRYGGALSVYGPTPTLAKAKKLLDAFGLGTCENAVQINWKCLELRSDGEAIHPGERFEALAFPVSHGSEDALGFRFGSLFISGDAICDEKLSAGLNGIATLIMDCGGGVKGNTAHAGAAEIARLLTAKPSIMRTYLTHVAPPGQGKESAIRAEFASYCGALEVLEDGCIVEFQA